jgi:3-phenylpropionate/trans-cinnamate dioxygenase ferredoxin subunit
MDTCPSINDQIRENNMSTWIDACATKDIDEEDLISWEYEGQKIAIYNTEDGFFATSLMCTHEEQSLEDGMVIDCVIECPLHGGRFDICTGKSPVCPCHRGSGDLSR